MTEDIHDQAAHWLAAQDADDMDWDGFTAWLEADPRHRAAFDSVALLDDDIVAQRPAIAARQNVVAAPSPTRRWRWAFAGGGAIAAALALTLTVTVPKPETDKVWQTEGAGRTVALADGSRAVLGPHSRLVATGGDQTRLALTGAAYFDVPHRPDRTVAIRAGDYEIVDIGTRFEVSSEPDTLHVAVAEGQVSVASSRLATPVPLGAGHSLSVRGHAVSTATVDPRTVASWRNGDLTYDRVALALVAADINRYADRKVTIDPRLADRQFSGTLTIGDGTKLAQQVAAILAVDVRAGRAGVRLEPRR